METTMSNNKLRLSADRQKKVLSLQRLLKRLRNQRHWYLPTIRDSTHQQIENFKKGLRTLDAEYAVTKNRLLKRALEEKKHPIEEHELDQPTATLFLYGDPIAPLKILAKMLKDTQKPTIKFGIMEGQRIDDTAVIRLSTLPPKEILLAQLMGMMQSPLTGLHRALSWDIMKFAMTLKDTITKRNN